jgi:hypothetical protein
MNVFYLNPDPIICAREHCDKHVVKMIIEYAQLMSTSHRMLDGTEYIDASSGRKIRRWRLEGEREGVLYKASHINHPDNIWLRKSTGNYEYLYELFVALCDEYTHRYGKVHETDRKLRSILKTPPANLPLGEFTDPPQAMPEHCKDSNVVTAYKNYYIKEKKDFAKWKNQVVPKWFTDAMENINLAIL